MTDNSQTRKTSSKKDNTSSDQNASQSNDFGLPTYITNILKAISHAEQINPYLSINHFIARDSKRNTIPYLLPKKHDYQLQAKDLCDGAYPPLLENLAARNDCLAKTFAAHTTIHYQPTTRLLLGADGPSPYSSTNLLKLHQLYGLPYLSASLLKGSLRHYWILSQYDGEEAAALEDPAFRQLFGVGASDEQGLAGALVFFDTFPLTFSLGLEVQTPHYPDYYNGGNNGKITPPTDTQKPVPLHFICLQNAKFAIPIACRDADLWVKQQEMVCTLFKELLTTYGLGAKTSLGYGQGKAYI